MNNSNVSQRASGSKRERTIRSTIAAADRYRAANVEAVKITIADPQYQGLVREVAERTLANAQAERGRQVLLADEGGGQFELFAPAQGGARCQQ